MSDFTANGKDGYDCLTKCKVIVDDENALELKQIITSFLEEAKGTEHSQELSLFKSNLEIFSPHIIRKAIHLKLKATNLAKKVKAYQPKVVTDADPQEVPELEMTKSISGQQGESTIKHPFQRSSSLRTLDSEATKTFKTICDDGSEKPTQTIDMTLLKRLRKFQLIGGLHAAPDGKKFPGIAPREEGRITIVTHHA